VSISVLDEEKTVKESVKIGHKYIDDLLFCQENDRNSHNGGTPIFLNWEGWRVGKLETKMSSVDHGREHHR